MSKTAIIIGAGPAGLTAAHELLARSDIKPIVLERSEYMGGISRTVRYKGNRIDIGGHRFFSKSDRVMNWWLQVMPLSASAAAGQVITYQQKTREVPADAPQAEGDGVMLLRRRKSRIYFLRKFFDYPIRLSKDTLMKLGILRTLRIGVSYLRTSVLPSRVENNLEQFLINRFGRELYKTFFQSYTEKVWGVPCASISAAWGAQRIKGLSIRKALAHAIKQLLPRKMDVAQKDVETSLIEQFLYPKFGPGQLWELVAERVQSQGGEIHSQFRVSGIRCREGRVVAVTGTDTDGHVREFTGDYFFSTMPIQELVRGMDAAVPAEVRRISDGLMYRDFVTVGLLAKKMKVRESGRNYVEDNWIYIQEPDVSAGRLQIFNNWSPFMVADPDQVWIGVEYFCNEGDALWNKSREEMTQLAIEELDKIGILERGDVLDSVVIKMEKTYPAYFGTYERFDELRAYLDTFENLFLVGRNGMHKYNNQDHAMLTAMTAVDNILAGRTDKANIWEVNTEMEYHETKSEPKAEASSASLRKQVATGAVTS